MRRMTLLVAIALGSAFAALGLAPAQALRTTGWAAWEPLTGSSNSYSTSMQLPAQGFPAASVATDSRSGSVGVQSGASMWFGATTPVGAKYGSSRDQPYLNLRPLADTATTPSTTTYTFADPTPPTGWAFVLGDIDADQVKVTAKDADGNEVGASELGFVQAFNLCDSSPRPGACSTSVGDVPTWNPGTQTLTGNPTASDTVGATGWFEPTVSLSSLTFVFTRRAGFPVYQTWFASVARTISGTVSDVSTGGGSCPLQDVTVRLVSPYGEPLATTHPDSAGAYSFGQYATQPGYVVSVDPADCAVVGNVSDTVSTAADDATADFTVRRILPQPVSGRVTSNGTDPLAGVTVTLHAPGGGTKTTTTEPDGTYLFDDNAEGDGYFVTIDVPPGYHGDDQRAPFDIGTTAVTGQDFDLTANADVSGHVTDGGGGVGGVTVVLTPSGGGTPESTVTDGDGGYTFERVPPGTYDISIETPTGYSPEPPLTDVVVAADDLDNQDFALSKPGAVAGTVHLDTSSGAGHRGVEIRITGPDGEQTVTTDADGNYFLGDLPPGTYRIRVVVPDGFDGVAPAEHTVTITDAGEIRSGQDFVITASPTSGPSTSPTSAPTQGPTQGPTSSPTGPSGDLPNTGSDVGRREVLLGGGMLLAGTALVALTGVRRKGRH
ncbi:MAG: carboxypeptidase regulatory-like domain-containing protein [Nocardioides sp.]